MTRINVLPVEQLTLRELVAEHHEITRVFALVEQSVYKGNHPHSYQIPSEYKLGKGHVIFFYNKLEWVSDRFIQVSLEIISRAWSEGRSSRVSLPFNLSIVNSYRRCIPPEWWGDYTATPEAMKINLERLEDRNGR